jgi:hypothetical protein
VLIYRWKKLILYLFTTLSCWGAGKRKGACALSAGTPEVLAQVRFERASATRPLVTRGEKPKKYSISRVQIPEATIPRGSHIDVSRCVRALQDGLKEKGWDEGVMVASANEVKAGNISVLTLRVDDRVKNSSALYREFDKMIEHLVLEGAKFNYALSYKPPEKAAASEPSTRGATCATASGLRLAAAGRSGR